jgi:hypothetical protein
LARLDVIANGVRWADSTSRESTPPAMGYGPCVATEDASVDHGVALDPLLAGLPIGAMSGEPTLEFRIADRPDVFVSCSR